MIKIFEILMICTTLLLNVIVKVYLGGDLFLTVAVCYLEAYSFVSTMSSINKYK